MCWFARVSGLLVKYDAECLDKGRLSCDTMCSTVPHRDLIVRSCGPYPVVNGLGLRKPFAKVLKSFARNRAGDWKDSVSYG